MTPAPVVITPVAAPFMTADLTACIPARSAASITEATRGHFPLVAGQVSAGVSMVAELTLAEAMPGEAMPGEVTDENGAGTTVKSIQGV